MTTMMIGEHVLFKTFDAQEEWQQGLLLRYDKFLGVAEIITLGGFVCYAPRRLVKGVV